MLRLAWQEPRCRASIQEAHRLLFWSREEKATFTALMAPELHWRAKGQTEYLGDVVADVEPRKPDWLLPPWLRRGKVHELVGKSTLTIWLAGQVFDKNQTGTVVIFTTEDDTAEDIRPRCMLAGVDMRRIVVYSKAITFADTEKLTAIIRHHGAVLAVFDTFQRYLPNNKADMNNVHSAQAQITPLEQVALDTRCALMVIRHTRKGRVADPLEAGSGSNGILGAMRSTLLAGRHPHNKGEYSLALAGGNYAGTGGSLAYRLAIGSVQASNGMAETTRVEILREEPDIDAIVSVQGVLYTSLLPDQPIVG